MALVSPTFARQPDVMAVSFSSDVRREGPKLVRSLPPAYPSQVGLSCGEANARSVVESFGLAFEPPAKASWTVRLLGYSLLGDLRSLLESHGLKAPIQSAAGMSRKARVDLLRSHLDGGHPVIIAIGNGHLHRDRYFAAARLFLGHYLTLYGFEDATERFFVYDSYLKGEPDTPLPAGNETRTYSETLRDWRGPLYYPLIGRRYVYIPIAPPPTTELN